MPAIVALVPGVNPMVSVAGVTISGPGCTERPMVCPTEVPVEAALLMAAASELLWTLEELELGLGLGLAPLSLTATRGGVFGSDSAA
ncbi:MAG TPA: hypothetical protein VIY26_09835 [Acidimicrobiales bacterium]